MILISNSKGVISYDLLIDKTVNKIASANHHKELICIKSKRKFIISITLAATLAVSAATMTAFAAGRNHFANGTETASETRSFDEQGRPERNAGFDNMTENEKTKNINKTTGSQPEYSANGSTGKRGRNSVQHQYSEPQPTDDNVSVTATNPSNTAESTTASDNSSNASTSDAQTATSGDALISIANPDSSYSPSYVSLSDYDRAKLERLVMGEAGSMGYEGCALVAQAIRDAMNLSNTSSIDEIISNYGYYGSTSIEPNADVKAAVSYIFDENGSAVQHRVLCFYIGSGAWHETQNFVVELGGVRFFDMYV